MEENKNTSLDQPSENIPKVEQIETPSSSETISPSEANILPTTETIETTNTPKENDMEVHHHPHHNHPHKKKWKEYFFEFLMLFLAVTLGFFVENQREHYIENLRAKEFSKSLIQDFQNDIAAIQRHKKLHPRI